MAVAPSPTSALLTVGEIARQFGRPIHVIKYAVQSRRIEHSARAGRYYLFDAQAVAQIATALEHISTPKLALEAPTKA